MNLVTLSLAALLSASTTGCIALKARMPHTSGRWKGQIIPVVLQDPEGNQYQAAAIIIREGTPIKWRRNEPLDATPRILVRNDKGNYRPEHLGRLPVHSQVAVRGEVTVAHVSIIRPRGGHTTIFQGPRAIGEPGTEDVLVIRGQVKPIE